MQTWQAEASSLRAWGASDCARVLERCVSELGDGLATWQDEQLSLSKASEESGYSISHLRRLVSQGILADVADAGPVQLRRGDLPRKPGRDVRSAHVSILRTG